MSSCWTHQDHKISPANCGSPWLSGLRAGQAMTQRQTKSPMTMEIRAHRVTRAHRAGDNTTGLSLLAPVCSALPPVPSCLHSHTQKHSHTHTHSQRLATDSVLFLTTKGSPPPGQTASIMPRSAAQRKRDRKREILLLTAITGSDASLCAIIRARWGDNSWKTRKKKKLPQSHCLKIVGIAQTRK